MCVLSFFLHFFRLVYDNLSAAESHSGLEPMFLFPQILFLTIVKTTCLERIIAVEHRCQSLSILSLQTFATQGSPGATLFLHIQKTEGEKNWYFPGQSTHWDI